jgi:hypothetical protein
VAGERWWNVVDQTSAQHNDSRPVEVSLEFITDKFDIEMLGKAARNLRDLLRDIEESITGEPPRATWEWDEATLRTLASPNGATESTLLQVAHEAHEAFSNAQGPRGIKWPETVSAKGQRAVREIVALLKQAEAITVKAEREDPITLRRPDDQPMEVRRPRGYHEYSEIEGFLDIISVRRRPRFSIRLRSGPPVGCQFPDEMIEQVKDALRSRVVVEGLVLYRADGTPVSVSQVRSLTIKNQAGGSLRELRGSLPDFTNGVAAGEYVREMREAVGDAD